MKKVKGDRAKEVKVRGEGYGRGGHTSSVLDFLKILNKSCVSLDNRTSVASENIVKIFRALSTSNTLAGSK